MRPLPPGPSGHWRLGSMRELRAEPLELYRRTTERYGDVVHVRLLRKRLVMVTNPDDVSHVLKEHARNYTKMTHGVRKLRKLMEGTAVMDGERWRQRRKLINPSFRKDALRDFFPMMRMATQAALSRWRPSAEGAEALDFSHQVSRLTMEIACRAFFGGDGPPGPDVFDAIGVLLDEARVRPYRMVNPPLWFPNRANRAYNRAVGAIGAWAQAAVKEREQRDAPSTDLLSALLRGSSEVAGLTMGELLQELQTFLVAAHDTTANAILWTLYYLSRDSTLRRTVVDEARALDDGPQSPDDLSRLPTLERAFNEALRLKSPAWILPRSPLEDDEIGGYRIPKGCSVYISPYLTHRHPDHWPDAETFDPSRFDQAACAKRHPTAFIPFGAGPRQCVGREFARMEALVVLSLLLSHYRFDVLSREAIRQVPLVTLKPNTFRVRLSPSRPRHTQSLPAHA